LVHRFSNTKALRDPLPDSALNLSVMNGRFPMTERDVFIAALQKGDPAERRAYLDEVCGQQSELRKQVEHLLRLHEGAGSFMQNPVAASAATGAPPAPVGQTSVERPETVIGHYKLIELIGEGGMGIVWKAEQLEPVRRMVALKVIKEGMDTRQVIARFDAERQALAVMDHPNIAKVFDAGATPDGRPFFVMELVKAVPITQYCDDNRLTPRQRLELFLPVCHALQHAHQKGIIHRDIKPSNVLVAMYDDRPVPKVIDFGVAKATGTQLTEQTLHTGFGAIVGTLEYMSPEQASFNQFDIDTRSDIYSLGVLLYELLTGSPPHCRKETQLAGLLEILRLIREQEPAKPSTRLSSADGLPSLAANRGTEPAKLTKLVRGELDWIVMKALEKDRSRRYETANGFAMDIQRYLADEPVEACPPSTVYRLRKFARRNRLALGVMTGIAGILMAATGISSWLAVRATRAEAAEAEHRAEAERNEKRAVESAQATSAALARERFLSYTHRIALAHREWLAGDIARVLQLLEDCPFDLRHWEWHYLRRLCNTEVVTFREHRSDLRALATSPDGVRVASVSRNDIRVWELATGKLVFRLSAPKTASFVGASYSQDGKRLAVAHWQDVTVHDAADGRELLRIPVYPESTKDVPYPLRIHGLAFSPDGQRLATAGGNIYGSASGEVKIWDAKTARELRTFGKLHTPAGAVAFSPDGQSLAASIIGAGGEDPKSGEVRVWETESGRLLHALQAYEKVNYGEDLHLVNDMAFSLDGKRLAAALYDGTVRIWEMPSGRAAHTLHGHVGWVGSVAFSPRGDRLASAGADRVVRLWDVCTGKEVNMLRGHLQATMAVAFSPDGRRLASAGGEIRVWEIEVDQQARTFVRDPLAAGINSVAFSPDSKLLASANHWEVTVHEVETGRERSPAARINTGHNNIKVRFTKDGAALATTDRKGPKLWDLITGKQIQFFPDQTPPEPQWFSVMSVDIAMSPDGGRLATIGRDGLTIWETATARRIYSVPAHGGWVVFSPNGRRIATSTWRAKKDKVPETHEVTVWNAETGLELMRLNGGYHDVNFSPDGTRLAAGAYRSVVVWDAETQEVLTRLRGHTEDIKGLTFSRDGRRIATASADHTIKIWDTQTGIEVLTLRGHNTPVVTIAFSPDSRFLASACEKPSQVKIWDGGPGARIPEPK
jgi:WD40 repeat protein/serine/threonine protein kinase